MSPREVKFVSLRKNDEKKGMIIFDTLLVSKFSPFKLKNNTPLHLAIFVSASINRSKTKEPGGGGGQTFKVVTSSFLLSSVL